MLNLEALAYTRLLMSFCVWIIVDDKEGLIRNLVGAVRPFYTCLSRDLADIFHCAFGRDHYHKWRRICYSFLLYGKPSSRQIPVLWLVLSRSGFCNTDRIINYLLTEPARAVPGNIGPRSFSYGPSAARSVLSRPRANIPQYGPRARLVRG